MNVIEELNTYKIYDEDMRSRIGINIAKYINGLNEGCDFILYLKGKTTKNWNNSYNKIINSCKSAKLLTNKTYNIIVKEIISFREVTNGDLSLKI